MLLGILSFLMSLPFILALAFVTAMVGIAAYINTRKDIAKKARGLKLAEQSTKGAESVVRAMIAEQNNGAHANIRSFSGSVLADMLKQRLFETFGDKVSILTEHCNMPEEQGEVPICSTVYGIKGKSNIVLYTSPYRNMYAVKDKPQYTLSEDALYSIEDYVHDNVLHICHNFKLAFASDLYDNTDIETIEALIRECRINTIIYETESSSYRTPFYSLEKDKGPEGGFRLRQQSREIRSMGKKLLDLSYSKVDVEYEGKDYEFPMGNAANLIVQTIENKENVAIFGLPRSGKSTLADEIARRVARMGNIAVIFVSPSMIEQFQDVSLLPDLIKELSYLKEEEGLTPLFIIDEAEHLLKSTEDGIHSITNSFMLSMMDGIQQKMLNCSFLLTFNCDESQLNAKAFMTGRMGLKIKLGKINKAQATELVQYLRDINPTMIFDQSQWDKVSQNEEILLAEVYGCFKAPSRQRVIESMIKAMAAPQDVEPAPSESPNITKGILKPPPSRGNQPLEDLPIASPSPQKQQPHGGGKKKWHGKNRGSRTV